MRGKLFLSTIQILGRTRLIYQHAFGDGVAIGVISVPHSGYDANRWWKFSAGLRDVIGETSYYVYARLFSL